MAASPRRSSRGRTSPALRAGLPNLLRHVENMRKFGLPVVVALNRFAGDTEAETALVGDALAALGTEAVSCTHWADGAAGAAALADAVERMLDADEARFRPLYPPEMPLADKLRTIAREIYRAADVALPAPVAARLRGFEEAGLRTVRAFAWPRRSTASAPTRPGSVRRTATSCRCARSGSRPGPASWSRSAANVMTMPGLPRRPAAESIRLDGEGRIEGLF